MMSLTAVPSSISATHLFVRFIRAAAIPAERSKPEPKRHAKAFDALAMRPLAQMSHNCCTLNLNANTETPMSTLKLRQVTGSRWNVYGSASKFKLRLQHSRPQTSPVLRCHFPRHNYPVTKNNTSTWSAPCPHGTDHQAPHCWASNHQSAVVGTFPRSSLSKNDSAVSFLRCLSSADGGSPRRKTQISLKA